MSTEKYLFDRVLLTEDQLAFTDKMLSSEALAAQIIDRIKRRIPTSVIRMSDGERGIIAHSQGAVMTGFMRNPEWLKRYGLDGADLAQVGNDLLWAGMKADYLACTISGLFWNEYKVDNYFNSRSRFIDQFYPRLWETTGRVGAILRAGPVLVLHRNHKELVPILTQKYDLKGATGMPLNSWRDQARLLTALTNHPATTILVSGGASGKPFCVRLAQATGKVVLDVGEQLTTSWGKITQSNSVISSAPKTGYT